MTPQPQQQYLLITEEELLDLLSFADAHDYQWTKQTEQTIRSRPVTSPTSYDHDVIGEFCQTARAEAAAQARETVLDEMKWMKPMCFGKHEAICDTRCAWVVRERCIQPLRTGGDPR